MSLQLIFQPPAQAEFFEAVAWYENESPGLGKEFAREVFQALKRACFQPEIFRKIRGGGRKIRLKRFKVYTIYFAVKDDALSVVAVFHGARNPADLRPRLK
jgi:plasmid stabilization system protein ParE